MYMPLPSCAFVSAGQDRNIVLLCRVQPHLPRLAHLAWILSLFPCLQPHLAWCATLNMLLYVGGSAWAVHCDVME